MAQILRNRWDERNVWRLPIVGMEDAKRCFVSASFAPYNNRTPLVYSRRQKVAKLSPPWYVVQFTSRLGEVELEESSLPLFMFGCD